MTKSSGTGVLENGKRFGTAPVFFTAISTILGAILFLRFGFAVGSVGFWGAMAIIVLGHMVTIPTAMALAEIATNQKVEGGGEYYIISRSFGLNIGATVGIGLYLSQAISVAFYVIAFAEAFDPLIDFLRDSYNFQITDKRMISIPAMGILTLLILTKGADLGVKALYFIVMILGAALVLFFLGQPVDIAPGDMQNFRTPEWGNFFFVFAICFPAFTGMTAGVGLSGDLKNPRRSIPLGTMAATLFGMVVYVLIAYKLAVSVSSDTMVNNQLAMGEVALVSWVIPVGLACATISSALGSILVAPRTLQALAGDKVFPTDGLNKNLSAGKGESKEPFNATIVTCLLAFFFISVGDVNFVAGIISMFFMLTYGSLCLISFLQHFAADPSYRPTFRSKWYLSLLGTVMCVWLMFMMNAFYALLAIVFMFLLYIALTNKGSLQGGLSQIFQGVIFQASRQLQVFLQKSNTSSAVKAWRPSVVAISESSFNRYDAFDIMRWISHKYGFGTYIHLIMGYLSRSTSRDAEEALSKLIKLAEASKSNVYLDTMVSPSYTSTIAQVMQLPGISGKENNMLLFEFQRKNKTGLEHIIDNFNLVRALDFDICILASVERGYGYKQEIHVWITAQDYENANLMILLAFIISGHSDWKDSDIKIFAIAPGDAVEEFKSDLLNRIKSGRLPISASNVTLIPKDEEKETKDLINENSMDADLTIIGFHMEKVNKQGVEAFAMYDQLGNVLFVNAGLEKVIE